MFAGKGGVWLGGEPADGAFHMCLLHWPFLVEEVTGWGGGFFKELRRVTTRCS